MNEKIFIELYQRNHIKQDDLDFGLKVLSIAEKHIKSKYPQLAIEDINEIQLDDVILFFKNKNELTLNHFIVLMRYYRVTKRSNLFIHLTRYTGGLGVTESILDRALRVVGEEVTHRIKNEITIPSLGTNPNEMPDIAKKNMEIFQKYLKENELKKVLAGNHHQIPKEVFSPEKIYYEQAETFDLYLKDLHERKVVELETCMKENRVWFEQEITPEVIEFVKSNQEILSAVRKGDSLYVTKIPYDTKKYLETDLQNEKAYYACHCPFIREAVKDKANFLSDKWCNCSAGFTKYPFEVLFDQELDVKCLKSAVAYDDYCRFEISLKGVNYKK